MPVALALGLLVSASASAHEPLPDLVADPPGQPYLEERTFADGTRHRLLRFDGYIRNAGEGRLEIGGSDNRGGVMHDVEQRLAAPMDALAMPTAKLLYEATDGHNHWHLRNAARYSLWDEDATAEVAPAEKVGFCLVDEQRTDGDAARAYSPDGCAPRDPAAGEVTMGLSPGWRDEYEAGVWLQWVDVSDVAPGSYRLRAEVDPDGIVREADEINPPADTLVDIPGWSPEAATVARETGGGATVVLGARASGGATGGAQFRIDEPPRHGDLGRPAGTWFSGAHLRYAPAAGAARDDTFTYSVRQGGSDFPRQPARAVVSLPAPPPPPVKPNKPTNPTKPTDPADPPRPQPPVRPTPPRPATVACGGAGATLVLRVLGRACAARAGETLTARIAPSRAGRLRISLLVGGRVVRICAWPAQVGRRYGCRAPVGSARGLAVRASLRRHDGTVVTRRVPLR